MDRRDFLKWQLGGMLLATAGPGLLSLPRFALADGTPDVGVVKGAPGAATRAAVEMLGGMGRFVKAGQKVIIKPNMSFAKGPESATTTHPEVVRELLVNALVHRPYTQRGDIFLNLHPDRFEIVNPGRLPLGVTPQNMLHANRRRNDQLARLFHDLHLMEKEGTGFDLMYEVQLSQGRSVPVVKEGADSVSVTIGRRVQKPAVIRLMTEADERFQLRPRERITLGLLAAHESLTARELAAHLELPNTEVLRGSWLGRLMALGLVQSSGKTQATRYFVQPDWLKGAGLDGRTTLKRMEPHRLRALVVEDLSRYPGSSSAEVQQRVAPELDQRTIRRALEELHATGVVRYQGERRWRRYWYEPNGQID